MDPIFIRAMLSDKIMLKPRFVTKEYTKHILEKLKQTFEGRCTYHGYIKANSIEIVKISCGLVKDVTLNGDTIFMATYYADVCNPIVGQIIPAKVINTNMFGILAENGIEVKDTYYPILEIVVAKNNSVASDLDTVTIGSKINIEVIGKKYELNDKKITVVGKIVKDPKAGSGGGANLGGGALDEEEEEDYVDDGYVDGDDVDGEAEGAEADGADAEEVEEAEASDDDDKLSVNSFDTSIASDLGDIDGGSIDGGGDSDKSLGGDLSD